MAGEQGELEGMRPKRIKALEMQCRELIACKTAQKEAKEKTDLCSEDVAEALKRAGLEVYGWKEDGKTFLVQLEDKELVKISVKSQSKKGD